MQPQFIHLRLHTEFSLVDGIVRIKPLVDRLTELNMPAVAVTEQSNLFSLVKFYRATIAAGIKTIVGADIHLYNPDEATKPFLLTLLVNTQQGYSTLTELISKAYQAGQHLGVPMVQESWLLENHQGLIALSGAMEGDIGQALLAGNETLAQQKARKWAALFKDSFYLELQRIGKTDEWRYLKAAVKLATQLDLPVVATNNVRFLYQKDFAAHEVRVCINQGRVIDDARRPKDYTDQQYLRSTAEMLELFKDIPEALVNTVEIAKRCTLELSLGKNYLPDFPVPKGMTLDEVFRQAAKAGLNQRLQEVAPVGSGSFEENRQAYDARLQLELDVICQMGFPGYFMIVADFIQWAKRNHIPVGPGRGSGAGSLVAYALKITDLDPIEFDLLFERFLNPERVSMPDFDIDFCMDRRDDVIDYVAQHYGRDKVSQIITYGSMAAKAVIRDVGRVLGHAYGFVDRLAKLIPFEIGMTLEKALLASTELKNLYDTDEEVKTLLDMAKALEGISRNAGKHAGGVVISPTKLTDFTPLYCDESGKNLVTQFDKDDVEAVGLVKFDFLGLRTLTIIDWALQTIKKNGEGLIDINQIPRNDPDTYKNIFQTAQTTAVFQLESRGMKELISKLKPDCFDDIIALVALYRPGPLESGMVDDYIKVKHGAKAEYAHPILEPILQPTNGVILYQEQVMQIAREMAGYTLGGADMLRRCLSGSTEVIDVATGKKISLQKMANNPDYWRGRKVFSLNLTTQKIVKQPITEIYPNGVHKIWEITTKTNRKIRATANHLFYTIQGWQQLDQFRVGDYIGLAKKLPIENKSPVLDAQIKLIAYLIGDGHLSTKNPASSYFCNTDSALIDDFNLCCVDLFGKKASLDYQPHEGWKTVCYARVGFISKFNQWIDQYVKRAHSRDKEIPLWVHQLSSKQLCLFLGILWSTDGSFDTGIGHTDYTSTSPKLIEQIQHLLLRLGIVALFNIKKIQYKGKPHLSYRAQITGREDMLKFCALIMPFLSDAKKQKSELAYQTIKDKQKNQSKHLLPKEITYLIKESKYASGMSWSEIDRAIGAKRGTLSSGLNFKQPNRRLARHRVKNFGIAFNDEGLIKIAESDVFWDEIVSIKYVGEEDVFDLSIPETHNFIANEFIAHNCMGKKKPEEMAKQREIFTTGSIKNNIEESIATYVFDLMEKFAGYGFNKCLTKDTLIANAETGALKKVADWYQQQDLNEVISLQKNYSLDKGQVIDIIKNGVKPVFKLTTSLGKTITVTNNHPFFTVNGWVTLDDLKVGDRVASPAYLPLEGKETWKNYQLISLGWILSEGNTCHPSGFYFYNNDVNCIEDFIYAINQFENTVSRSYQREDRNNIYEVYVGTGHDGLIKKGDQRNRIQRSGARLWLESLELTGIKAPNKSFPDQIFQLSNKCIAILIGRLWSGDGFIATPSNTTPYFASSSYQLVAQLQHLLLRFKIISRVTQKEFNYKEGRIGYTLHILGRRSIENFITSFSVHIIGKNVQLGYLENYLSSIARNLESIDTVPAEVQAIVYEEKNKSDYTWQEIEAESGVCVKEFYGKLKKHKKGFRRVTILKLAEFFNSEKLHQIIHPDLFWERVVSIEAVGEEMTYDLEIKTTHNFVANDIIVHNSHSAAYALVAYQTAWLKAHYPAAFMAAVLSADMDNTDKVVMLIEECRQMKLDISPPNVNVSIYRFTTTDPKKIIYGLGAIKGVGQSAIEDLINERDKNGLFSGLYDLCKRVELRKVNRRVLEALIRAGAFDLFDDNRAGHFAELPIALRVADQHGKMAVTGQNDLFGLMVQTASNNEGDESYSTQVEPWAERDRLEGEKQTLGLYLTGHPINQYQQELRYFTHGNINKLLGDVERARGKVEARVAGLVLEIRTRQTKKGTTMGFAVLDDRTGRLEVAAFSKIYEQYRDVFVKDALLVAEGGLAMDDYSGMLRLTAEKMYSIEQARATFARCLAFEWHYRKADTDTLEFINLLRDIIAPFKGGDCPLVIYYFSKNAAATLQLGEDWRVQATDELILRLQRCPYIKAVEIKYA